VGTKVLPDFLSVVFDPTLRRPRGGFERLVRLRRRGRQGAAGDGVDQGVLKTFLDVAFAHPRFDHSNGHGRRQPGLEVVRGSRT